MSTTVELLKQRFIFFGRNSGVHGLNHLFKENSSYLARLFWLTAMVVSSGCLYLLIVPAIQLDGGINFTPDTLYLGWTSIFPAVTVCDLYSLIASKAAQQRLELIYPELLKPLKYDQKRHVIDLLYGRGKCTAKRCTPCGESVPCDVPWRTIMEKVHKKCEDIITDCFYMGEEFPCGTIFHAVDSEFGPCCSFNSRHNALFSKEPLFTANRTTGPPALEFRLLSDSKVTIHSTEELSTNHLGTEYVFQYLMSTREEAEILFSMVEMENDPMLTQEVIEDRECRFPHEIPDDVFHTYPVYSYGACKLAKSTRHSYQHCGCITPIRDISYQSYYCNFTGMNCLAQHEAEVKIGLELVEDDDGVKCLPSCVETELSIIHDKRTPLDFEDRSESNLITIRMSSLPTLRYHRNVLRTNLDFVVSVGGMAGLFFSASILSAVEIFYLILRTPKKNTEN